MTGKNKAAPLAELRKDGSVRFGRWYMEVTARRRYDHYDSACGERGIVLDLDSGMTEGPRVDALLLPPGSCLLGDDADAITMRAGEALVPIAARFMDEVAAMLSRVAAEERVKLEGRAS
jgi:hypothetical protein